MQITKHVHMIRIPFTIPLGPGRQLDRFVWVYLVTGRRIWVIDAGVAGSWPRIEAYLQSLGQPANAIDRCLFTHAHPDHIGGAQTLHERTGCGFACHAEDRAWIEDVALQACQRPVPGFGQLVEGPVAVAEELRDGQRLKLEAGQTLRVIHTPGHSRGHLALVYEQDRVLFTGDCVLPLSSLPIYEDPRTLRKSIAKLQKIEGIDVLLSSLAEPIYGQQPIAEHLSQGADYVGIIDGLAKQTLREEPELDPEALARRVIARLGLPEVAVNSVTIRAINAHRAR
ncbi:MAG: MBL fold metallo-hydrolase [Bacillota bacterium]